jgi:hypothetical protein
MRYCAGRCALSGRAASAGLLSRPTHDHYDFGTRLAHPLAALSVSPYLRLSIALDQGFLPKSPGEGSGLGGKAARIVQ